MKGDDNTLTVTAWNARSITAAKPYIRELMCMSELVIVSEHRLFPSELYKLHSIDDKFMVQGKASSKLNDRIANTSLGHGGIAIFWNNEVAHKVITVEVNSDRICAIEIIGEYTHSSVFIIGVYLPQAACKIDSFENHVNILNELIQQCQRQGDVIVIGDWNCQFSNEHGSRFNSNITNNGRLMASCIYRNNLSIVDGLDLCSGPLYTYQVEGVGQSYIDHIAVSEGLVGHILKCAVIDDCVSNTSDHLPITVTIEHNMVLKHKQNQTTSTKNIKWHKLTLEQINDQYTQALEEKIESEFTNNICHNEIEDVEHDIDRLNHCINSACSNMIQVKKPQYLKPYWNKELTQLAKNKKQTKWKWKQNQQDNQLELTFKEAKRKFRKAQRHAEREYERRKIRDIAAYNELDQSQFWYLVNKRKQKRSAVHPIKLKDGNIVCEPEQLCREWINYFQKLYTPNTKGHFNEEFKVQIEDELQQMIEESQNRNTNLTPFKNEDIENICSTLKTKKAPGYDGIAAEHFKFAGPKCMEIVAKIFNSICVIERAPIQFKRGVLIPIPKGDKDRSLQDNHRGITLLQTMRKMFEKGLLKKNVSDWVKSGKVIEDLQGANQESCSSLETNWLVRETIHHYTEQNTKVYVCMLDVKKAFDSVWQVALFHKLYRAGMDPKVWRIVMDLYSNPQCCVRISGALSRWITALQGIIQGGPLSMISYEMMSNDLLIDLKKCEAGTVVGDIITTAPAFADDLIVTAPSRRGIQKLLDLVYEHSCKWRYEYNASKCAIVVFKTDDDEESPFQLGEAQINILPSHGHVGTILACSKWDMVKYMKQRIEQCDKPGYAIMSIGSRVAPMTPKSASNLYWSICIPKLTYGCQIMELPEEAIQSAERYHAKFAKVFQGLPDQACNIGAVAGMGWMSIGGYIEMMALLYFMRIVRLSVDSIYKRLFIRRYCYHMYSDNGLHSGPVMKFIQICKKYELLDVVKEAIENCVIPSKMKWKQLVGSKIWERESGI